MRQRLAPVSTALTRGTSLTAWEQRALAADFDLADGHPGHLPSAAAPRDREPASQPAGAAGALDIYLHALGQNTALSGRNPLVHYSASMSIDIAAKALRAQGCRRIGVSNPTFDNIPQLLRRQGLDPIPLPVSLDELRAQASLEDLDAVFLVLPNNPSGYEPSPDALREFASHCAAAQTIAAFDFSFRAFARMSAWDQYVVLDSIPGLTYLSIEDTGKTLALDGLKLGALIPSDDLEALCADISNEMLLNVAPAILHEVGAAAAQPGWLAAVGALVAVNRRMLRASMPDLGWTPLTRSELSVEWVELPAGMFAEDVCERSLAGGVGLLPGTPFYWDRPEGGDRYVRASLYRSSAYFEHALERLVDVLA